MIIPCILGSLVLFLFLQISFRTSQRSYWEWQEDIWSIKEHVIESFYGLHQSNNKNLEKGSNYYVFVTKVFRSLGRSLLSARGIFPQQIGDSAREIHFNLCLFPCLIFSTCCTSLTWVFWKFKNLDFGLDLVYFYFFFNIPIVCTFTLGTVHRSMHLTFSNIAHLYWSTPEPAHMLGTFEKLTCFLFKSIFFPFVLYLSMPLVSLCVFDWVLWRIFLEIFFVFKDWKAMFLKN